MATFYQLILAYMVALTKANGNFGIKFDENLIITKVNTSASSKGIKISDEILYVDGRELRSKELVMNHLNSYLTKTVNITFIPGGMYSIFFLYNLQSYCF